MRLPIKERTASTAVVIPTAIVVIVLAFLQYRWSNQVSESTNLRLADSLQMSLINWHRDFFRDFSQICLTIQVDPGSGVRDDLNQYVRRFDEWKTAAAYPDLISNLYLVGDDGRSVLLLNMHDGRFEEGEWPSRLAPLREKLPQMRLDTGIASLGASQDFHPSDDRFYRGGLLSGWQFDPATPALVHPVGRTTVTAANDSAMRNTRGWLVIELNSGLIKYRILPDLTERYFQGTEGLDYQVAVLAAGAPGRVLYSSDSEFGKQEVSDADGRMDLFGRLLAGNAGSSIYIFHKPSVNRLSAGVSAISWFPLLYQIPPDQDWELVIRHRRGGPLGAFGTELRRRDLAISFGVLLLLVVSMAMLVITSYRAQRLAKLQMNFVTAVSHELRTPLTVIRSAADNIAQGVVEGKQQVIQYGTVIGVQVRQLCGLVEQILLFAATRQGHQHYTMMPLKVSEIIDAALASTEGLIQAAQFKVELQIEPNLPQVQGDLLALSQCLQNLITNALKYSSDQNWIGIRARFADNGGDHKEVQVSVSDRGMGISTQDLPHIFEPFYRSPSVAASQIHGTGLGLPVAKSIAEAMRGQLKVTSIAGRGSTFTLCLPCTEQHTREAAVHVGATVASSSD